ncbi:hypothetical protein BN7_2843 [Wickerhamomyces ciferrii]|uniref:Transcription regulator Rua1 C-terminal domain-containing protein n=1 Tax=Wickerhamomyces ciferrii (strain ATCC 14091 / BCRC 22168 / CBS 111 / JCM 3599 / NBRC 0793 / NRRL Y-1031 F-60-10) TaxID=1206466 RepID=K0KDY5_WICCF|nr:uncharacterized protein BN7_2843 [Wickerhamomyces ciferrii]CCH43295.1 hypothetical protein BN7_2843 [Wickerhamomyces ciferrii]
MFQTINPSKFYQTVSYNQPKSEENYDWYEFHIKIRQQVSRYALDFRTLMCHSRCHTGFHTLETNIIENPLFNENYYNSCAAIYTENTNNGTCSDNYREPKLAVLCPFCYPEFSYEINEIETFLEVENRDYERHLRELHGVYPDGIKAPQPFIGDTVLTEHPFDYAEDQTPDLKIICSHHLENDKSRACLAGFSYDKNSKEPLADYFNHYYHTHVLHEDESQNRLRFHTTLYKLDDNGEPVTFRFNHMVPISPYLHIEALLNLREVSGDHSQQPFVLLPWDLDVVQNSMDRLQDVPSFYILDTTSENVHSFYEKLFNTKQHIYTYNEKIYQEVVRGMSHNFSTLFETEAHLFDSRHGFKIPKKSIVPDKCPVDSDFSDIDEPLGKEYIRYYDSNSNLVEEEEDFDLIENLPTADGTPIFWDNNSDFSNFECHKPGYPAFNNEERTKIESSGKFSKRRALKEKIKRMVKFY